MEDKKLEILEKAAIVFLKYGIKSVTMDDMARELVMSKKTLYQYFKDKNDLVETIVKARINFDEKQCFLCSSDSENAIDELYKIGMYVSTMMKDIHPSVFFDLKKFHPLAWKMLHDLKWEFVKESILTNIKRGKKEKIYRKEIKDEIVATMFVGSTDLISNGESFFSSNLSSDQLYLEMISFQIHGMVNELGLNYLNNKYKK